MNLFLNKADFELRKEIEEIDALPADECPLETLAEREEMVQALKARENWS
jgi:hypothetical protein